jgi:hypothetical protein
MSRDLPEFPNLEHLKKQAKVMLRELRQRQPSAKLADAQLAIARGYGFASWTRLKEHIESLVSAGAHGGGITGSPAAASVPAGGGQFARYTEEVRRAIFFARAWARKRESALIESEHLMLGLLDADPKLMDDLLGEHTSREMEFRIRREMDGRTTMTEELSPAVHIPVSSDCRRVLENAAEEADRLRHERISTGHFWLAFLHDEGLRVNAIVSSILAEKRMPAEKMEAEIIRVLNAESL